jgi:ferredoxin-NADP reductase
VLLTLKIREVLPGTPRSCIVRIALDGQAFPYRAGQAVMIADHGQPRRRAYSIAAAPDDAKRNGTLELLIGVDAQNSPGSHLALRPGNVVDVEGPIGQFTLPDHPLEDRLTFIAGGTGIAPLRAMLHEALKAPCRGISVLYSARTPAEFAYADELQQLAATGRIEFHQTVTRNPAHEGWNGLRGRIGREHLAPLEATASTCYFVCGPRTMVADISGLLRELGAAPRRIRLEEWASPPRETAAS